MRYTVLSFLLLHFSLVFGQQGNYFLSHYSPGKDQSNNMCFDIVQDGNGLLYFATRTGIMEFDGLNWELVAAQGAIYSLQISGSGEIYWAGATGYGKMGYNDDGIRELKTLSENTPDVFQCQTIKDKVYFVNEEALSILSPEHGKTMTIRSSNLTGSFGGIFELFGTVYINTEHGGIFKVVEDKLVRASLGFSDTEEVIFSRGMNNHYLLGLADNRVFLCGENLKPREIMLEDQKYAEASVIVNGGWVNKELIVLGTLRGGMIYVHAASGKTQEIINYSTGLPDNEVFALLRDKSQSIWAAHEYGYTRVSPYLPFRSFSHYPGLQGNLLCATTFQGHVYVGTSLGLFRLEKEDIYEEIVHYLDVEIKEKNKPSAQQGKNSNPDNKEDESVRSVSPETESKRGGFLRFLRRNRNKTTEDTRKKNDKITNQAPVVKDAIKLPAKPRFRKVKKVEQVLRTSHYVFRKVEGVDAKVNQLVKMDGKLIAAGLGGTFEINALTAKSLLAEPTRFALASEKNMLFVSTYRDEVRVLTNENGTWKPLNFLNRLDDQINFIFDGHDNEIWLCAMDKVYRLEIGEGEVKNIQTVDVANPNFDDFGGIRWKDEIVLINSQGFFQYEREKNAFTSIDTLALSGLQSYYASGDNVLFRDQHNWNLFGQKTKLSNIRLLSLFDDLRFLSPDPATDDLWIITGNNELYRFFGERFTPYDAGYPVILKTIRNADKKIGRKGELKFSQDKSSLTLEVVQPNYLASPATEYRYLLDGLEKGWTEWSTANNMINFPYLPSGDYALKVQARDILGRTQNMQAVTFKVLPPYWQRPWFYALEFFVFASLVLLSFRLSTRYRIISRILSLLTIIMLIQFIQTVIGETFETKASPVTDFFVQVFIAFMILPVEGYLRNLMLRSLDSHSGLYRFLSPKVNPDPQEQQDQ